LAQVLLQVHIATKRTANKNEEDPLAGDLVSQAKRSVSKDDTDQNGIIDFEEFQQGFERDTPGMTEEARLAVIKEVLDSLKNA